MKIITLIHQYYNINNIISIFKHQYQYYNMKNLNINILTLISILSY